MQLSCISDIALNTYFASKSTEMLGRFAGT